MPQKFLPAWCVTPHSPLPSAPNAERPPIRLDDMTPNSPPEEDDEEEGEPVHTTPIVSYILIGIITLIFIVMMSVSGGNLGGLTVHGEYSIADLFGQKNNALIDAGQFWRFLTPVFLHGSILHLLTNGLSLYWLGTQIERIYGGRRYLIIYIVAGIAGNLVSYWRTANPSLGASGAIFGLIGAGLIFPLRFRSLLPKEARDSILSQLLMITVINIGMGMSIPAVDNMAHMGGLVGGGLVALFLIPDVLDDRPVNRLRETVLSLIACVMVVLVFAAAALQANWARTALAAPTTTFASSLENPYWTVRVPQSWTWNRREQAWVNADGAKLMIADNVQSPGLVRQVETWMAAARNTLTPRLVDGKPAMSLELLARDSNRFIELVRVEAYDRRLVFVLIHKGNKSFLKTARDFVRIMRSVRIIHPPTVADKPNSLPVVINAGSRE
jgi:rhomboid protease GluP